jgi:DNA-binding transcriptional LysR family regulator
MDTSKAAATVPAMLIRQFEYLVALAREQHFGRAADACHVTQPTLSAAIRQFEEELGAPVIERGHRYLGLTPQGKLAVEHAQRVLAEIEDLKRGVEALDKGVSGRLRLGVIPTALPVVSQLTMPFLARFPGVTVAVLSCTSQDIQRGLEAFEMDAGLTYLDAEPLEHLLTRPIYTEEYAFLTPLAGPYADRERISWREAAEAPLCLLTPDMQNRRIIDGVFRSVGATPKPSIETNSIFNLVAHTASGPWSAIVPRQLLQFFGTPPSTRALELVEPTARRSVGLVIADRHPVGPLARKLMDLTLPDDIISRMVPLAGAVR